MRQLAPGLLAKEYFDRKKRMLDEFERKHQELKRKHQEEREREALEIAALEAANAAS